MVEMPSGMKPILRGIGFGILLRTGLVPDYLTDSIVKASVGLGGELPAPATPDEMRQRRTFLEDIAKQMFVSPKIVDLPAEGKELGDDEITIDDVPDVDLVYLVPMVGTPTAWLDRFSYGQAANLASLLFKQGLPDATESVRPSGAATD